MHAYQPCMPEGSKLSIQSPLQTFETDQAKLSGCGGGMQIRHGLRVNHLLPGFHGFHAAAWGGAGDGRSRATCGP